MGIYEFAELFVYAFALSMDAFAVSICKGLSMKRATLREGTICGAWFGGFQGLMPVAGFLLGALFRDAIEAFDYWVAFGLLAIIGFNMLKEAFEKCECCEEHDADLSVKTMFVMAVATSIDALAVGVDLSIRRQNIYVAAPLIGIITFLVCAAGVKIGSVFGGKYEKKAQALGGFILMGLAIKFLVTGLIENFF